MTKSTKRAQYILGAATGALLSIWLAAATPTAPDYGPMRVYLDGQPLGEATAAYGRSSLRVTTQARYAYCVQEGVFSDRFEQ